MYTVSASDSQRPYFFLPTFGSDKLAFHLFLYSEYSFVLFLSYLSSGFWIFFFNIVLQ